MAKSKIEWTDATWNPLAGCTPISPGCTHCYAATMAKRLEAMGKVKYTRTAIRRGDVDVFTGIINLDLNSLADPLKWKRPRMVFVNSMSDLFHNMVPWDFVDSVFATMYEAQWHTFQVLTKRPGRMAEYLTSSAVKRRIAHKVWWHIHAKDLEKAKVVSPEDIEQDIHDNWPLPNVWLGTSCEDQLRADERIPHLLNCRAAVRFVSAEPLLGSIDLSRIPLVGYNLPTLDVLRGGHWCDRFGFMQSSNAPTLNWVIVGGESGHNARPMHPDWARSLRDQCVAAGVPFFFKQWGEFAPCDHGPFGEPENYNFRDVQIDLSGRDVTMCPRLWDETNSLMVKVGKKEAGRLLDGRTWDEMPKAVPQ